MSFNAKEFKNFIVSLIMIVKLKGKLESYCDDFVDLETKVWCIEFLLQKNYQKVLIIWENFVHSISTK